LGLEVRWLHKYTRGRSRDFETGNAYRTELLVGVPASSDESLKSLLRGSVDDLGKVDELGSGVG
jgi:hypothetical protein